MFLTNFNFKMIAPSEKRTTIKFHWYKTDKNWFYHWNNNIIVNLDFGNSEITIDIKNNKFGGVYKFEKIQSEKDNIENYTACKLNPKNKDISFTVQVFKNYKKVIIENKKFGKISLINGNVKYDGMKFYNFFEEAG